MLFVTAIAFVVCSCDIEDGGERTAGLASGGFPGYIKTIDDVKITYDSQGRVRKMVYEEDGYSEICNYSYSSNLIILSAEISYDGETYKDEWCRVYLNDSGCVTKIDEYYEGDIDYSYSFTYAGGLLSLADRNSVTWDANCNMTKIGDDVFTYNTSLANSANLDINMFLTNSEKLSYPLYGPYIGCLGSVKGFRSTNMIDTCYEERVKYDVDYEFDSQGRITKASWNKSGSTTIDITYY